MEKTYISSYGACLVSRNICEKKGRLYWCVREESQREIDNGWRFLSEIDTEEYLNDIQNWCILPYEAVIEIEPAVLVIYDMPTGTDIALICEGGRKYFVDTNTGIRILR
ncbi:MAG: DUF2185 domain-containing protein [Eubacteriaceae bacterium]